MLSVIPSKVPVITGAVTAPKPTPFFRKKIAGGARRALAALGTNNAQLNMSMAKTHLAMAQEDFSRKWNFSPLKEVPLTPGRYQWAPLSGGGDKDIASTASGIIASDIANPAIESPTPSVTPITKNLQISGQEELDNKCSASITENNQENIENEDKIEINYKQEVQSPSIETTAIPMQNVSSSSQNCITDFFKQKKRKSGYLLGDCKPCPNTPPKKKSRSVH